MRFTVLKALPKPGMLSESWKLQIQQSFAQNPDGVRGDYDRLVRSIADLELMEQYIRKDILHKDEQSSTLRQIVDFARDINSLLGPALLFVEGLRRKT